MVALTDPATDNPLAAAVSALALVFLRDGHDAGGHVLCHALEAASPSGFVVSGGSAWEDATGGSRELHSMEHRWVALHEEV
ncbi:hypothetical protein HPP92_012511 [Vanilla planifolia]|uniref:Uncharacterized protein n=1 Tax=Vanilla planifolia TaxID=51239 RepID=A0A835R1P5_VANPL|nr:hypothetical protein HPP92_012903 [Vanilla planifolia]KAG0477792.1 hypothetical protein HPP92_012511 [Vanilla planifolia]